MKTPSLRLFGSARAGFDLWRHSLSLESPLPSRSRSKCGRSRPRAIQPSWIGPGPSTRRPIPTSTSSSRTSRTKRTRPRSRSRSSAPIRPTCSSTGQARMPRASFATGWLSTSPNSATRRAASEHSLSEGWQASFMSDGKNYGIPIDAVSKYFYYNKSFFAEHNLTPPADFDGLLGLCKADPRHRRRTWCRFRSAIPSAGSSITTSQCSMSACSARPERRPTMR